MRETWEVDGLVLTDGLVMDVEYRDGLNAIPVARGGGGTVAGRHGEVPGERLKYGPGSFVLNLWMERSKWPLVQRAAGQVHRLHEYVHGRDDGSRVYCRGRLSDSPTPEHIGQKGMRVGLEVYVPDAFWFDELNGTDVSAPGALLPKDLLLTTKANATAPMDRLVYTITGPVTNPQVMVTSDPELFDSFTYQGTVPAGATLLVDAENWALSGTGGFVPDLTRLKWTGDRWLEVPPAPVGLVPAVRLLGTGGGAQTSLTVTGPGAYLC